VGLRGLALKKLIGFQLAWAMRPDDPLERRRRVERSARRLQPARDVVSEPVSAGGVKAEWLSSPGVDRDRVLLHLHGGGYYTGSIATHRDLISRLGRAAGMRSLAVDYRLAPEHPFPAALDDATTAYRWLLSEGFDPARIVLAGDSSGGGLALATLVKLRDDGVPLPARAVLLSPWTDLALTGDSVTRNASRDPINRARYLEISPPLYAGSEDVKNPLISPLYADPAGLPPLLIQVGSDETLLDDSTRFAERARAAGVDVTLEIWPGMFHVFQMSARFLPEARRAIEVAGAFMRAHAS